MNIRLLSIRALCIMGIAAAALPFAAATSNSATTQEVVVTINRVRALDVIDAASKADFVARVTIAGQVFTTPPIRNQDDIQPTDWVFRHKVRPGAHPITIEILDKDVTRNDVIDINRAANKRSLDVGINTRLCQVTGLSELHRCGTRIVRAGTEPKKAEITFTVDVR
ncbi:MAG: hypothetical protein ACKVP7_07325 [Hyphomicrobiaceae bacterium]